MSPDPPHAYYFTDSVQFCGQTCHSVMRPEYTTYLQSPSSPKW